MERVESLRTENKFKKTEIGEIPVDWEVVKIQDVCEKAEYGYTESATEKLVGPKFLRISDIQNGNVNWESVPFCHCPNLIKEKYLLKPGDILFARTGATTGKSYIIKRCPEAVFASYLIRIVTKERINSYFLYLVFNSFIYWRQIKEQIGGSAQGGVNASSLSSIKVPLPPLPEQKKIAEILLSVDEAIGKKQEIIEKTKILKKSLMQELLTQGIGHKKFEKTEIGEIPVDWEVVKLGEVTQIIMGQSPLSDSYFEFVNGVPFFQGNAEFGAKFPKILKWCNSPRKLAETGDILVSVRAPVGDVNIAPIECCIGRGLAALRGTKIHNDYLYFVINYFKDTLVKIGQGSTFEAINKRDIFELKIPFPTILEQKKIAEILTSVDEEIEKEMAQKERMENIKKGLIQVLLTGKIRVKI